MNLKDFPFQEYYYEIMDSLLLISNRIWNKALKFYPDEIITLDI